MPISPQEARRRLKEQASATPVLKTYVVTDEHFRPDAQGGIGGVRAFIKDGKHCLRLTDSQAKYWLDQGVIAEDVPAEEK